jgi:GMP synthase-like glutamine amidotransferase
MTAAPALVIENSPGDPVGRLGDWLTAAGLSLRQLRPHAGEAIPESVAGYAALIVLGGGRSACAEPETPWFPALRRLLRRAVSDRVPTLAICLGGQLLAQAYGGRVAPAAAGPEIGPRLVARRDVAGSDPLFAQVPFTPDVIQWHFEEIVELPAGAVLLATSPNYQVQAFRMGARAWGTQFHIEPDAKALRTWAYDDAKALAGLGQDPDAVADACVAALDDVAQVWRPVAQRFAGIALGTLEVAAVQDPMRRLPVLGE